MTRSGRARARLVVMTRFPEPGRVKTRLAAAFGDAEATRLHRDLARYVVTRARACEISGAVSLEVRLDGGSPAAARAWLGRGVRIRPQATGTLGDRLRHAVGAAFAEGAPAVVAIGTDCPDCGGATVRAALAALDEAPVVLGPASDGGYYLVGVRASAAHILPTLFTADVPWGTSEVLGVTRAHLTSAGVAPALLGTLPDVDRPEDVAHWERHHAPLDARDATVSVIVPALDEERVVGAAISSARAAGAAEVVVADSGSADGTARVARDAGVRVIDAPRGRAQQMNAGAAVATGDVLLFLHADTSLPLDAAALVRSALAASGAPGGAFGFAAGDPASALDRAITAVGRARYALFGLPYGDQAIFVRRTAFEDLGGFPDLPVLEDYEFARRLRALGGLARVRADARTSARAWHDRGLVRAAIGDVLTIAGYRLGVDPTRLAPLRRRG